MCRQMDAFVIIVHFDMLENVSKNIYWHGKGQDGKEQRRCGRGL